MVEPFKRVASRPLMDRRIFKMREDDVENPRTGRMMHATVIECTDWCNIIPITKEGNVVLVKQWRHGTRKVTLEIPGGLVDPGETALEAARRELLEETGYAATRVIPTGRVAANPAIMDNDTYSFLAVDVEKTRDVKLDDGEDIEVLLRPLKDIPALIANGEIDHCIVIAAFFHLANMAGGKLGELPGGMR